MYLQELAVLFAAVAIIAVGAAVVASALIFVSRPPFVIQAAMSAVPSDLTAIG